MTLPQLMRLTMLVVLAAVMVVFLHDIRAAVQTSALFTCTAPK